MTRISLIDFAASEGVRPVAAIRIAVAAGLLTLNVYASEGHPAEEDCDEATAVEAAEIDASLVYLTRED
jgi:hypothetical protein